MDGMKHEARRVSFYSLEKHCSPEKHGLVDKCKVFRCGNNNGHSCCAKKIKRKFWFFCHYCCLWCLQISIWNMIIFCCHPPCRGLRWLNSFHPSAFVWNVASLDTPATLRLTWLLSDRVTNRPSLSTPGEQVSYRFQSCKTSNGFGGKETIFREYKWLGKDKYSINFT